MKKFGRDRSGGDRGNKRFGGRDSGTRGFGGRGGNRDFRRPDRERSAMFDAICDKCGKACQVPFRPSGDKPVYCSDCFSKNEGSRPNDRFERRPSFGGDKKMFDAICAKCGTACQVPFRPTGDKPVYCSNCFTKGDNRQTSSGAKSSENYQVQFDMLNSKLDRILKFLNPAASIVENKKEIVLPKKIGQKTVKKTLAVKKAKAKKKK
ncbi:MAG: hypothetical protein C3F02_01025 [Parcubacteria group bacterium]|nr:MAG: hypothetical protein C3F02_01025 [Parcubacteria group bacterium]